MCYCCMYKRFFVIIVTTTKYFIFFKLLNHQFLNIVALIVNIYENYRSKMHDQMIVLILMIFDQFIISLSYNLLFYNYRF